MRIKIVDYEIKISNNVLIRGSYISKCMCYGYVIIYYGLFCED